MALTKEYNEIINERLQNDPEFATALFDEAISLFLNGESDVARVVMRDLLNATIGFETLAKEVNKPSKSLHRMLTAKGNPTMDSLSNIFKVLKRKLTVEIEVHTIPAHSWVREAVTKIVIFFIL